MIVYLSASPGVILRRTANDAEERPLLKVANPTRTIKELLRFRKPFYERAADITVNTSRLSVDAVAKQIIARLKKYEGFSL